jgi:hypothetical protein
MLLSFHSVKTLQQADFPILRSFLGLQQLFMAPEVLPECPESESDSVRCAVSQYIKAQHENSLESDRFPNF